MSHSVVGQPQACSSCSHAHIPDVDKSEGFGIAVGIAIGVPIGLMLDNIAAGIAIGLAIGIAGGLIFTR